MLTVSLYLLLLLLLGLTKDEVNGIEKGVWSRGGQQRKRAVAGALLEKDYICNLTCTAVGKKAFTEYKFMNLNIPGRFNPQNSLFQCLVCKLKNDSYTEQQTTSVMVCTKIDSYFIISTFNPLHKRLYDHDPKWIVQKGQLFIFSFILSSLEDRRPDVLD